MATAEKENETTGIVSNVLGSATAGIIGRIVTHPLDTAKARLQSLSGTHYAGPFDVLVKTFRSEGVVGLYRGFPTVIAGGTPGTIIYLCGYDIFKEHLSSALSPSNAVHNNKGEEESFVVYFTAGLLAETVACLIYVPVDVIKERLQIQYRTDAVQYKGGWDALVNISKTEGPMGIYKGYGATLASFGPFSALVSFLSFFCLHTERCAFTVSNFKNCNESFLLTYLYEFRFVLFHFLLFNCESIIYLVLRILRKIQIMVQTVPTTTKPRKIATDSTSAFIYHLI